MISQGTLCFHTSQKEHPPAGAWPGRRQGAGQAPSARGCPGRVPTSYVGVILGIIMIRVIDLELGMIRGLIDLELRMLI